MAKLSDTQKIVLSKAAQRDDGAAVLSEKMTKAAAAKIAASLVARKLMREIRSKPGMPVWRAGGDGRQLSLVLLKAGRDAIGVESDAGGNSDPDSHMNGISSGIIKAVPPSRSSGPQPADSAEVAHACRPDQPIAAAPRPSSKTARVIEMLSMGGGATIDALVKATGWLPHTTRAALTGLRKRGFSITRTPRADLPSLYRIALSASEKPGAALPEPALIAKPANTAMIAKAVPAPAAGAAHTMRVQATPAPSAPAAKPARTRKRA